LGSNQERQQPRLAELQNACDWLGFELEMTAPNGLEKIRPETRANDPARWNDATKVIAELLAKHSPRVIFFPHEHDGNSAHVGTHFLIMDALKTLPENFQCALVETEFWASMASPNLMVESSVNDAADLIAALSFHVGEVKRNPYHLRLPAWMQDNVRRGAERVGGQGGVAPDFQLATLYKARQWKKGRAKNLFDGGRQVGIKDNPAEIFAK
jgi:LmbE family N-acetylglucosaminyl deacetylase